MEGAQLIPAPLLATVLAPPASITCALADASVADAVAGAAVRTAQFGAVYAIELGLARALEGARACAARRTVVGAPLDRTIASAISGVARTSSVTSVALTVSSTSVGTLGPLAAHTGLCGVRTDALSGNAPVKRTALLGTLHVTAVAARVREDADAVGLVVAQATAGAAVGALHRAVLKGVLTEVAKPATHTLAVGVDAETVVIAVFACLATTHVFVADAGVGTVRAGVLAGTVTLAGRQITGSSEGTFVRALAVGAINTGPPVLTLAPHNRRVCTACTVGPTLWLAHRHVAHFALPTHMADADPVVGTRPVGKARCGAFLA